MRILYVRWRDACTEDGETPYGTPTLAEMHEVGFFLGENEEALTIGMEMPGDATTHTGRWRLHIPKNNIIEVRELTVARKRKPKNDQRTADGEGLPQ